METRPDLFPAVERALQGLPPDYQALALERYHRILPVLLKFLRPRDVLERNRTWAGVSPTGKGATSLLLSNHASRIRACIKEHGADTGDNVEELWLLFRAYCRYGPVALADALPSSLPPMIPQELQECADFHKLAKHPRADAGVYIRQILDDYADDLNISRLHPFLSRYAFAVADQRIERWFFGESSATQHVSKTTRRLNRHLDYPHQKWIARMDSLPIECHLSRRQSRLVKPWLVWIQDEHTQSLMGFRLCPSYPTVRDLFLALRWSIWHYGAPWWKARGAPEVLVVPSASFAYVDDDVQHALHYTHTHIRVGDNTAIAVCKYPAFPENFDEWFASLARRPSRNRPIYTDLHNLILDYVYDMVADDTFSASTPSKLTERAVSLPWSDGIASTLFLPSSGNHSVLQGKITPFGIPFDVVPCGLEDGKQVDVRYDPDDAHAVFVIYDGAVVVQAGACAFEHPVSWLDLLEDPEEIGVSV
jgi:hypothetical protein